MSQGKILIIEDEAAVVTLLKYNLEKSGYDVSSAMDGEEGLIMVEEEQPDLLLVDWMLPHVSGVEICRRLRRNPDHRNLPIIMLTARGEESDTVRGLESGADDYMVKPFSPSELQARIQAVLRRSRPSLAAENLSVGNLMMDLVSLRVYRNDTEIKLGPTEFKLLRHFMENPGRVYSREQLLDIVWGRDVYVETRTVDVHIRRLRKNLNDGGLPDLIRTVRSAGYSLDDSKA